MESVIGRNKEIIVELKVKYKNGIDFESITYISPPYTYPYTPITRW